MKTMTYNEAFAGLESICESAFLDYEIAVLTEADALEGTDETKKAGALAKIGGALGKVKDAIVKLIKMVVTAVKNFIQNIKVKKIVGSTKCSYDENMRRVVVDPGFATTVTNQWVIYINNLFSSEDGTATAPELKGDEKTGKAGTTNVAVILKAISNMGAGVDKIRVLLNRTPKNENANSSLKDVQAFISRMNGMIGYAQKLVDTAEKLRASGNTVNTQTEGTTRLEKAASLLLEMAQLLKEEEDGTGIDHADVTNATQTVDQDPIDAIPGENPAVAADPDPVVSGGEGPDVDLDEVKDLVDGDKEALDILTTDEGGKVVTESVVIDFGW